MKLILSLDKHPSLKRGYQVSIRNGKTGRRLAGPKYDGSSVNLITKELDVSDAMSIKRYVDEFLEHHRETVIDLPK